MWYRDRFTIPNRSTCDMTCHVDMTLTATDAHINDTNHEAWFGQTYVKLWTRFNK